MPDCKLDKIQSNLEAFLSTAPDSDAVNSLIERLKEYESDRQRAFVKAYLEWKKQLPENFPQSPRFRKTREQFRRIYNQLKTQGISVTYSPDDSDDDSDESLRQWALTRNDERGRLMLYSRSNEWAMHGMKIQDKKGNFIPEFDYIYYAMIVTLP